MIDKRFCQLCGKPCAYHWVEYAERELVPTADGGMYAMRLLPFCEQRCLMTWLNRQQSKDEQEAE